MFIVIVNVIVVVIVIVTVIVIILGTGIVIVSSIAVISVTAIVIVVAELPPGNLLAELEQGSSLANDALRLFTKHTWDSNFVLC